MSDGKTLDTDRESPFENFRIGHAGVSHVAMNGIAARMIWPSAGAPANSLIILILVRAVDEVVDGPLGRG